MSDDPLAAALERLWQTNGPALRERGQRVLAALTSLAAGDATDLQPAAGDAHVVAGALGTYGRPGSEVFATAEQVLKDGDPEAAGRAAQGVRAVLTQLG